MPLPNSFTAHLLPVLQYLHKVRVYKSDLLTCSRFSRTHTKVLQYLHTLTRRFHGLYTHFRCGPPRVAIHKLLPSASHSISFDSGVFSGDVALLLIRRCPFKRTPKSQVPCDLRILRTRKSFVMNRNPTDRPEDVFWCRGQPSGCLSEGPTPNSSPSRARSEADGPNPRL